MDNSFVRVSSRSVPEFLQYVGITLCILLHRFGPLDGQGHHQLDGQRPSFGIGYAERLSLGGVASIFGTVDAQAVLVRLTRYGDADLNGVVNLLDFNKLAANFNGSGKLWSDGDFTYDGNVNLLDFNRLAANFNLSCDRNRRTDAAGLGHPCSSSARTYERHGAGDQHGADRVMRRTRRRRHRCRII